jgi:hypothetical protein
MKSNPAELAAAAACRQHAERVPGAPRSDSCRVTIEFDWEVPAAAGEPTVFLASISRSGRKSSIRFGIDLKRLQSAELEKLHDFLARYHARLTTDYELAWHLSWLVETWFSQLQPDLTPEGRHAKLRALLLCNAPV